MLETLRRFLLPGDGRTYLYGPSKLLPEAPALDSAASLRGSAEFNGARLLYIYYTLASASPAVQDYFTASLRNLEELMNLVVPAGSARNPTAEWRPEAARMVRLLKADGQGLILPIDPRFGPYLFPNRTDAGGSSLHVSLRELTSLLQSGGQSNPGAAAGVGISLIEFLMFIRDVRPEIVTDGVIKAMMRSPAEAPVFLDLIWDVLAPPELLVPYIDYCWDLSQKRNQGWNVNRTRTSQAIFFLISAFCREGTLDAATGQKLLKAALSSFVASDETSFLTNVSTFITGMLLPELVRSLQMPADAPQLLREALAGPVR